MTTTMAEAMKQSGVPTGEARLATLAYDTLRRTRLTRYPSATVVESFAYRVIQQPELLMALLDVNRVDVLRLSREYLQARADEMAGATISPACQTTTEGQKPIDRRDPSQRTSQACFESQSRSDRAHSFGAGQDVLESQNGRDRPSNHPACQGTDEGHEGDDRRTESPRASQRESEGQGALDRVRGHRPKAPAQDVKIAASSALRVATSGIFALKVGMGEKTYGDLTRFDCVTLRRKGMVVDHLTSRLLSEVDWPDDHTPLSKVISEKQAREYHESAYRVMDKLGLTNVGA